MGEIIFSLFIGGFLSGVGLLMNRVLYLEQKKYGTSSSPIIESNPVQEPSIIAPGSGL